MLSIPMNVKYVLVARDIYSNGGPVVALATKFTLLHIIVVAKKKQDK